MARVLVAYATLAGSTAEVARAIADTLQAEGLQVEACPVSEVSSLAGYDAAVIGAPMILGWHRAARRFVRRHRRALERIPFAVFVTAMSLTRTEDAWDPPVPIVVDPGLAKAPSVPGRLTWRERYATVHRYAGPILAAARPARPVSLAFFAGRLDYGRLKWWAVLFAMVVVQARAGERRNWEAIRSWARDVSVGLRAEVPL